MNVADLWRFLVDVDARVRFSIPVLILMPEWG